MVEDGALLTALPGLAFAFALVLARAGMVVMLLPGLGEAEPPAIVRSGLAMALAVLLVPAVSPLIPPVPDIGWGGAAMIGTELLVGATLGWLARLPSLALGMAGAVLSYTLGLSSVVQQDPALGGQSAALSRLFSLAAPVLILSAGLYALPLQALAGSYRLFPPGTALPAGPLTEGVTAAASACFGLAIRLSAPFLLAGLVFQVALGLLARLVPQLQVYSAAIPGQILGGMALLGVLAATMLGAWTQAMGAAWSLLPGL